MYFQPFDQPAYFTAFEPKPFLKVFVPEAIYIKFTSDDVQQNCKVILAEEIKAFVVSIVFNFRSTDF